MACAKSGPLGSWPADIGRPLRVLMQKDDVKTRCWAEAAQGQGIIIEAAKGSPLVMPFEIIRSLFKSGRPDAVVFRYLNDYPSLFKSILRFVSEIISLMLCCVSRFKVIWICHNVDRETDRYHPRLSSVRRSVFAWAANSIFVLDRLLVTHAQRVFPSAHKKIDYITFGELNKFAQPAEGELLEDLRVFIEGARSAAALGPRVLVGLCVGSPAEKVVHFDLIPNLIERVSGLGYSLYFVILGPVRDYLRRRNPAVLNFLETSERIFFVGERVVIDEPGVADLVDFYWRAYSDFSVPLSLYGACTVRKPILTIDTGFLGEAVLDYGLGAVLESNLANLSEAISSILTWDPSRAEAFLRDHTWKECSHKLTTSCCS